MKIYKIAVICLAALSLASCGKNAGFYGEVKGVSNDEIIVKLLDVNRYEILDTLKTDESGAFSYKMSVEEGQPEFVYLFRNDVKIASMILQKGDKLKVQSDTLGNFSVEGSEESEKLQTVEMQFSKFAKDFLAASTKLDDPGLDEEQYKACQKELSQIYIKYYREATKYVLANQKSLTVIPVLYQSVNELFPIFSQETDAIIFKNTSDSLKTVYPDSKYVKALAKEAERRGDILSLSGKFSNAVSLGYPDVELPDINGKKVRLSEVETKVVLIHFWTAEDNYHKIFNLEVLKPIYEKYHDKGFEIYSICTDVDKALWASVVKNQELPWINVCDALGGTSQAAISYGVTQVPATFILVQGTLTDEVIKGEQDLRKLLDRVLK